MSSKTEKLNSDTNRRELAFYQAIRLLNAVCHFRTDPRSLTESDENTMICMQDKKITELTFKT